VEWMAKKITLYTRLQWRASTHKIIINESHYLSIHAYKRDETKDFANLKVAFTSYSRKTSSLTPKFQHSLYLIGIIEKSNKFQAY
jgi:hypothetical protein